MPLTEEVKRWKKFLLFFKGHRYISPFGIISTNENGPAIPLKFVVHSIKNLSLGPQTQSDIQVNVYAFLSATFFSKKKGKFFGRTYKSAPIRLAELNKGGRAFETSNHHTFYCHSQVDDSADSSLILELEVKGTLGL